MHLICIIVLFLNYKIPIANFTSVDVSVSVWNRVISSDSKIPNTAKSRYCSEIITHTVFPSFLNPRITFSQLGLFLKTLMCSKFLLKRVTFPYVFRRAPHFLQISFHFGEPSRLFSYLESKTQIRQETRKESRQRTDWSVSLSSFV